MNLQKIRTKNAFHVYVGTDIDLEVEKATVFSLYLQSRIYNAITKFRLSNHVSNFIFS